MTAYHYGGFWRRALAMIVDKLFLYCLFFILTMIEFSILPLRPYSPRPDAPAGLGEYLTGSFMVGHVVVFAIMSAVYFTYFHGLLGQTPGKMLLGLKVIRTSGRNLTYGPAFLRWVCYAISSIFFYLGFIWAAFNRRKQAWHDKIMGTLVIRVNDSDHRRGAQQLTINI